MRENFGPDVEIVIFNDGHIGGRLEVVNMEDEGKPPSEYEIGGTVIHPKNQVMHDLVKAAGLQPRIRHPASTSEDDGRFTIYGSPGEEALFQTYFVNKYLQALELCWHYGLRSLYNMNSLVSDLLQKFAKVYTFLDFGHWKDTEAMLNTIGGQPTNRLIGRSLTQDLEGHAVGRTLIEELVTVAVRVNYGQMPESIHAFVGYISLAGAEGGLWSIEGGNWKLPQALVDLSQARLVKSRVMSVKRQLVDNRSDQHLKTASEKLVATTSDGSEHVFDIIVVAAPQTSDKSPLDMSDVVTLSFPGNYHRTVATLVRSQGGLNPKFFNIKKGQLTSVNFFVNNASLINSVSKIYPASHQEKDLNVYKVFSQDLLSYDVLDSMFNNRSKTVVADWLAYPHYKASENSPWPQPFKLAHNLYYTSAVEWAGSAMEMSAIAAKNVANFAFNEWFEVKQMNGSSTKTEL